MTKKAKERTKHTQINRHKLISNKKFDKSHICPDHPHCATSTKVVIWGGVSDVLNYANFTDRQMFPINEMNA